MIVVNADSQLFSSSIQLCENLNPGGLCGARLSLQRHAHRGEHWVVVEGVADVVCGENQLQLRRGEHIHIPPQTNHRLGNSTNAPLAIIEVQLGDYLGEDDIVRLDDDYKRIA